MRLQILLEPSPVTGAVMQDSNRTHTTREQGRNGKATGTKSSGCLNLPMCALALRCKETPADNVARLCGRDQRTCSQLCFHRMLQRKAKQTE